MTASSGAPSLSSNVESGVDNCQEVLVAVAGAMQRWRPGANDEKTLARVRTASSTTGSRLEARRTWRRALTRNYMLGVILLLRALRPLTDWVPTGSVRQGAPHEQEGYRQHLIAVLVRFGRNAIAELWRVRAYQVPDALPLAVMQHSQTRQTIENQCKTLGVPRHTADL